MAVWELIAGASEPVALVPDEPQASATVAVYSPDGGLLLAPTVVIV